MSAEAPLFGLVLAGGASTRMQRDKAAIEYHGQSQLHWTFHLLSHVCAATFVSVRPDQREDPTRVGFPQIVDRQPGIGPIAGISAALAAHPKAAWLVVACDLPFLNEHTLRHLVEHRDVRKLATAYKSSHDGLPEPLCAIWEPASREPLLAHLAAGKQCPRKFLINAESLLLDLPDARALDNVNTTDEYRATVAAFGGSAASPQRTLKIQYYAILREQAGRSEETLDTTAATPAELYNELSKRHPFQLSPAQLKVALNSEFSDWHTPLRHGDTVVFIPPVAGG
ncbi:NTP transferase domain-containing protein [Steroidobacter sp.]|uniref:NTP transferase domain-containing protein n=1 Tax=Steroidobacter sp. TaxID=1978227 RepID=UPI001A568647|nr:NTP transferase domain-containing protein [Steroidobacter sp.]MBL8267308.1 NTP transferase domain-containing protein [Steroidobacter sp.]